MKTRKVVLKIEESFLKKVAAGALLLSVLVVALVVAPKVSAHPVVKPAPSVGTRTVSVTISGMVCGSCVARVTNALSKLPGITDKKVTVGSAVVTYDSALVTEQQIKQAIEGIGYTVTGMQQVEAAQAAPALVVAPKPAGGCGCGCGG